MSGKLYLKNRQQTDGYTSPWPKKTGNFNKGLGSSMDTLCEMASKTILPVACIAIKAFWMPNSWTCVYSPILSYLRPLVIGNWQQVLPWS